MAASDAASAAVVPQGSAPSWSPSAHRRKADPRFAKMQVVPTVTAAQAQPHAQTAIQPRQVIKTDGLSIYPVLAKAGYTHQPERQGTPERASVILPWVHTVVSNAKRCLQGTYHREAPKHLQRFLEECCYRLNRRWWHGQLFERLLTACTATTPVTYAELVG